MPDEVKVSYLQWLANEDNTRANNIRIFREYYDGSHDTQLTERMRSFLQVKTGTEFNTNYCPIVVDAVSERLRVTGLSIGGNDEAGQAAWDWWTQSRMDAVQGIVHRAAVRDGDTFLLVSWDDERAIPVFTYEPAFDGAEGVKVHYDPQQRGRILFASKRWLVKQGEGAGSYRRLNLYFADRVEKYFSDAGHHGGEWSPFADEGEPVMPWISADGKPLGVPIVHFKNRDQGYDNGESEIADVLPLQNALNKTLIDLIAAADTTGFRIYWATGADPSDVSIVPGGWVYSEATGEARAQFGYFPGENLSNLIALKDSVAMEVARVTRTPLSYFQITGQVAAEGTLKQQESGLVAKVHERQTSFGNSWEDAIALARRLANTFGGASFPEDEPITVRWDSAETRDDVALMTVLQAKKGLGIPTKQLWREAGYSEDEIAEMEAERQEEQEQEKTTLAQMYLNAQRQFDQGTNV